MTPLESASASLATTACSRSRSSSRQGAIAKASLSETGYLQAFDAARNSIQDVAREAYANSRRKHVCAEAGRFPLEHRLVLAIAVLPGKSGKSIAPAPGSVYMHP